MSLLLFEKSWKLTPRLTSEDEFCVTETLTAIQSDLNTTLSISNLVTLVGSGLSTASAIPTSTRCSDCSKAAYSILKNDYPSLINGTESDIEAECGATFTGTFGTAMIDRVSLSILFRWINAI